MLQLVDYSINKQLKKLDTSLSEALEFCEETKVERILRKPFLHDGSPFMIPYQAYFMRPSSNSLSYMIANNMYDLVTKMLNAPYNVKPNEDCLVWAVHNRNHRLFYYIARNHREMINQIEDSNTMCTAIEVADFEIVKYLVEELNFAVFDDLYDHIFPYVQSDDIYDAESRSVRNEKIRAYLKEQIEIQRLEDLDNESEDEEPRPVHRNLANYY